MILQDKIVVYIGDFDFRNENVQSFLVRNNGKILNQLGYSVRYIGINSNESRFRRVEELPNINLESNNNYFELPNTLKFSGFFKQWRVNKIILSYLHTLFSTIGICFVISYQSPSFFYTIKKVARWCKAKGVKYIVNSADLPVFHQQSLLRQLIMWINWHYLHKINKRYADGVISVSTYIEAFYQKINCKYVVIPPLFDVAQYQFVDTKAGETTTFIYAGTPFKVTSKKVSVRGMKDRLDRIIDIFLELSRRGVPYVFKIVGITKEDYLKGVPRHINSLFFDEKVVFLGRFNHRDVLNIVADSDFSINYRDDSIMSRAGFSTKIVESISLGTPVVINQIGDAFNYLEEGISGFKLIGNLENDCRLLSSLCFLTKTEREALKEKVKRNKIFDIINYLSKFEQFMASLKGI